MDKRSLVFLKKFMETNTPSGFEAEGQKLFKARITPYCDTVEVNVHGNVSGIINGEAPCRIMLAGHCDEIGLMVTDISKDGFISFTAIGGVDPSVLPGSRVVFVTEDPALCLRGVIGRRAIHLMQSDERKKSIEIRDLWIDIGAGTEKEARKHVHVGMPACLESDWTELNNNCVASKAWDDKVGSFIVSEVLKDLHSRRAELKVAVIGVSTVQEEIGSRGAMTASYTYRPHAGIAIDVGFATDAPGDDKKTVGNVKLGKGPILHRGANHNVPLVKMLEKAASANKLAVQWSAEPGVSATDADPMQISRTGMAATLLSIPTRYMHTPVETVSLTDIDTAVKLIVETILALPAEPVFIPF